MSNIQIKSAFYGFRPATFDQAKSFAQFLLSTFQPKPQDIEKCMVKINSRLKNISFKYDELRNNKEKVGENPVKNIEKMVK